jgi:murein DD-endopeptidase MepM/ murein hydrolase activator NlpD
MKKQKLVGGILAICLAFTPFFAGQSLAASSTASAEKKLEQIRQNKKEVQSQLSSVQQELESQKAKVHQIEQQIDKYDQQLSQLNAQLAKNEEDFKKQQEIVNKIIVEQYKSGTMNYTVQLLRSKSFAEFLANLEIIRLQVKKQDYELKKLKDLQANIEKEKKAIEEAKQAQLPLLEEEKKQQANLEKTANEASAKLKNLQEEENITEAQIAEMRRLEEQAGSYYSGDYGTGMFIWPAQGTVTSGFGYRWGRMHEGIDIANKKWTPIYAADDGVVTLIKSDPSGYGIYIVIKHNSKFSTLYAHMYRYQVLVSVGEHVRKGQQIASIGDNGHVTGPHLHFEVHVYGNPVDPMKYLPSQ